jgi:hypothetical protein
MLSVKALSGDRKVDFKNKFWLKNTSKVFQEKMAPILTE